MDGTFPVDASLPAGASAHWLSPHRLLHRLLSVFPCDPKGRVEMDRLSDRERNNCLYARAMVGRDPAAPVWLPSCALPDPAPLRQCPGATPYSLLNARLNEASDS